MIVFSIKWQRKRCVFYQTRRAAVGDVGRRTAIVLRAGREVEEPRFRGLGARNTLQQRRDVVAIVESIRRQRNASECERGREDIERADHFHDGQPAETSLFSSFSLSVPSLS